MDREHLGRGEGTTEGPSCVKYISFLFFRLFNGNSKDLL